MGAKICSAFKSLTLYVIHNIFYNPSSHHIGDQHLQKSPLLAQEQQTISQRSKNQTHDIYKSEE
jgi:hypothetical protein